MMEKYEQYKKAFPNKTDAECIESLCYEVSDKVETIGSLLLQVKETESELEIQKKKVELNYNEILRQQTLITKLEETLALTESLVNPLQEIVESRGNEISKLNELMQFREEEILNLEIKLDVAIKSNWETLPEDCILGHGEVKFCPHRQGNGNECKHCAD